MWYRVPHSSTSCFVLLQVTGNSIYLPSVRKNTSSTSILSRYRTLNYPLSIHKQCRAFIYTTHDALPFILDQSSAIDRRLRFARRSTNMLISQAWNNQIRSTPQSYNIIPAVSYRRTTSLYRITKAITANCNEPRLNSHLRLDV